MKRWTSTWTAMLVVGFLAVPGIGLAQTSPAAAPSATSSATAQDKSAQGTPQEHLQEADAALNSISPTAVSGKAKSQIADLKKHVNSLQKMTASTSADASANANATSAAKWSTEATAADKIFGELLSATPATGDAAASVTAEPKPTGTSGTTAPKASAHANDVALDDETKAKLTAARVSLTAFAAAMSGTAPAAAATASPAAASVASPATAAPAEASASAPTASPTPSSPEPSPASPATPAAQPAATPAQQPATPSTPPAEPTPSTQPSAPATPPQQPATPTEPTSPAQPPASSTQPPAEPTAHANVNPDAAKQALTAARDSLAQMTQLPAAQALTGEPRAQVSQLISNFNELITTSSEWKAAYGKVDANLNALLGSQGPDESAAPAPATAPPSPTAPPSSTTPPTAGAAGAVGTSGTTTGSLDPAIKAKLVEFRTHLKEFEKAAGGSAAK
jgi:hypothetical protein